MIASDLNNPEFVGATNPDSRLAVMFYSKPMQNEFKTAQEGRPIFQDMDMVKISVPGDVLNVIDTFAREEHKNRFPIQWAHYQNKHGSDARQIGTPVSHWPLITPSQAEELRALKFYTVENIANASDSALQRLGMIAGMSPYAFRDRAANFLKVASQEAQSNEAENMVKKLEEENARIKAETDEKLSAMQTKLDAVLDRLSAPPAKRGPKPKEEVTQ